MPPSPGMPKNTGSDGKSAPASTLRKRTRGEIDSDAEDVDTEDYGIPRETPIEVFLAGPSGQLDNLTRPVDEKHEIVRANDYTETAPSLRACLFSPPRRLAGGHKGALPQRLASFFCRRLDGGLIRGDGEILQSKTLTYIRDLVKSISKSKLAKKNSLDITRLPVADRKARIWVPLWHRRGLELLRGMYREFIWVIDFDIIMRPPTNLPKGLNEKLQKWRMYLMLCFCLAAEASCKLELLPEVRPRAIIRAPGGESVSIHWRRLPHEKYIHVPDLTDLPVFERMSFSTFCWKHHEIGCPSGHSFLDTTDMVG
ncbi:hypothetical protein IWX90DRAFT_416566 [Phyllosticta citrichinensis]|uniref:Uncharacterized protein n=1 Tax=Phyllosticta citrichinensis TaxID=1130410 RepID=A0ABR1XMV2_9PEZI